MGDMNIMRKQTLDISKYVVKRIIISLVTILLIASITFLLMNLVPGDPFLNEKAPTEEVLAELRAQHGLDLPLPVQLKNYLVNFAKGDMGVSFKMQKNRPVYDILKEMFPTSAKMGLKALSWALVVGIVSGCLSAYYRGKWIDSILRVVNTLGVALPTFVTATLLMVTFTGGKFNISSFAMTDWKSMILPVITLGLSPMCHVARYTRTSMLDALGQDYIQTARAKGLSTPKVIFKHALRNALIPVVTYIGPLVASLLTGSLVVEQVFNIPGLGRYLVQSIHNRDYPLIMGTTIFLAAFVILMNLVVDILYVVIDPRMELSGGGSQ